MDISAGDRRRAFSVWLRTGRLPRARNAEDVEFKFNPWHDPENGRFTFAGTGRYFGRATGRLQATGGDSFGGGGATGSWDRPAVRGGGGSVGGGGASGSWDRPAVRGGGGSFGGGGASGSWDVSPRSQRPRPVRGANHGPVGRGVGASGSTAAASRRTATGLSHTPSDWRRVVRNGYEYQIDSSQRTRRVSGSLTLNRAQGRSRRAQAQAGGEHRRPSDHGGHYIARRFNGPTDAFNHFAQDASFNRGRYRALEDQWARAKVSGRQVTVRIVPAYAGRSRRPSALNIWFSINGNEESVTISNEPRR